MKRAYVVCAMIWGCGDDSGVGVDGGPDMRADVVPDIVGDSPLCAERDQGCAPAYPNCCPGLVCVGTAPGATCREPFPPPDAGDDASSDASSESSADTGPDTRADRAPLDCDGVRAEAQAFVAANKSCARDEDCVQVGAGCYSPHEDCCVIYLRGDYDAAAWTAFTRDLGTCAGGACACCAAIPRAPACNAGTCGPAAR